MPSFHGDGSPRSRWSQKDGALKDQMRKKVGMGTDGTDDLDKMRDARC